MKKLLVFIIIVVAAITTFYTINLTLVDNSMENIPSDAVLL